jgi:hypothetical protein
MIINMVGDLDVKTAKQVAEKLIAQLPLRRSTSLDLNSFFKTESLLIIY